MEHIYKKIKLIICQYLIKLNLQTLSLP